MASKNTSVAAAVMLACIAGSTTAFAYEAGDYLVRGRLINIAPNEDSGPVEAGGAVAVPGSSVGVDNAMTLDIDITRMVTPNFGVELLLDLSSKHEVPTGGTLKPIVDGNIIETRVLPPALIAQYHFTPGKKVQPYAGLGVNYTYFFDETATSRFKNSAVGASNVKLKSSWGLAAQVGADIDMGNGWFFNVDAKYIDVDTVVTFDSTLLGRSKIDLEIDPWVFGVGFGRKF